MCETDHQWRDALTIAAYLKAKSEGTTPDEVATIYNREIAGLMGMTRDSLCGTPYGVVCRCPAASRTGATQAGQD